MSVELQDVEVALVVVGAQERVGERVVSPDEHRQRRHPAGQPRSLRDARERRFRLELGWVDVTQVCEADAAQPASAAREVVEARGRWRVAPARLPHGRRPPAGARADPDGEVVREPHEPHVECSGGGRTCVRVRSGATIRTSRGGRIDFGRTDGGRLDGGRLHGKRLRGEVDETRFEEREGSRERQLARP